MAPGPVAASKIQQYQRFTLLRGRPRAGLSLSLIPVRAACGWTESGPGQVGDGEGAGPGRGAGAAGSEELVESWTSRFDMSPAGA